jgi:hypothetical protein
MSPAPVYTTTLAAHDLETQSFHDTSPSQLWSRWYAQNNAVEDARAAMGARSLSAKMVLSFCNNNRFLLCTNKHRLLLLFRASPEEHFVSWMTSRVDRPGDGFSKDQERERHEAAVQDQEAAASTVMTVPAHGWSLLVRNRLAHLRFRINSSSFASASSSLSPASSSVLSIDFAGRQYYPCCT